MCIESFSTGATVLIFVMCLVLVIIFKFCKFQNYKKIIIIILYVKSVDSLFLALMLDMCLVFDIISICETVNFSRNDREMGFKFTKNRIVSLRLFMALVQLLP